MAAAHRQLAEVGAAAISLRSIAREVGMVSSAVYRYVESRDDLLTRLIVEAYDALGEVAEHATAEHVGATDLDRWVATTGAIRSWALEHPHQYLLLYGSPVPGYAAPDDTVVPGTRVTFALVAIVRDAHAAGRLDPPATDPLTIRATLTGDLDRLNGLTGLAVGVDTTLAFLAAWTQMFGLISFELTSQTRGMVEHHAELFEATTRLGADRIGLR
jgi:AcrR family transcriptional regulator